MKKSTAIIAAAVCAVIGTASLTVRADRAPAEAHADEVSQERIYSVGSISKVYVTVAVMQLAAEGRIDTEAPVTEYIPEFKMADERYKKITVRMLMDHTSGMEGTFLKNEALYGDADESYSEALLESLSRRRLKAEPGEYAAYCNDGFCLLQMIVERVSGMPYADYLRENISAKTGALHTGTPADIFKDRDLAQIYRCGNIPHDYEYCMALGSGGIYATASEVAEFGSRFFTGDESLLPEAAKDEMAKRWDGGADEYSDGNGLGWDYVEDLYYRQAGVKVIGKGGDIGTMHAQLLVAPDEKVSISVLSAGGSSFFNGLMAGSLLDVVLEERGKEIDRTPAEIKTADSLPADHGRYEGYYSVSDGSTSDLKKIWSDENAMYSASCTSGNTTPEKYLPTSDGGFVRIGENGGITPEREVLRFCERNGKVYIRRSVLTIVPGIGGSESCSYFGERIDETDPPEKVLSAWEKRADRQLVMCGGKYSSTEYDSPFLKLSIPEQPRGYITGSLTVSGAAESVERSFRLEDESKALFFGSTPSSASRDIFDLTAAEEKLSDGRSAEIISASNGWKFRFADELPEFTKDITEIKLCSEEPKWYRIGKQAGGSSINAERPEKSVICVYNRYRELIYTTHVEGAPADIPLPTEGYILFHGETGGKVKVCG
ncbi:MAG: beta-lactamase family protein [Ruminococcus sp.]|nr:beta-lactamase family protein [Ruminococcus sp.]